MCKLSLIWIKWDGKEFVIFGENKNVRARIKDNILRFKEGIDFIDIKGAYDTSTLESFGYSKQSISQSSNIFILSERGYSKLIKIMDTYLSWEIIV